MAWEVRMEGRTYQCLADPTGELNEIVWSSLGHMRGTVGYNTIEANTTEGSSAVRWPQVIPIDIRRPTNLQLNEWYWPSLHQHPSELWVAIAGGDDVLASAAASISKIVTIDNINAVVIGAWKLSVLDKQFPDVKDGEASPFKDIVVLCLSDGRVALQYKIYNPYASNNGSSFGNTNNSGDPAGRIGRWPDSLINLDAGDIVPCPRCAYEQEPCYSVWLDVVIMGLGQWPVYRIDAQTPSSISSHSASADNDLARAGVHVTPCFAMPTTGSLTDQKSRLDDSYVFPNQIVNVNYILRYDKFALGDKVYEEKSYSISGGKTVDIAIRPRISTTAVTAFFENLGPNGSPTGSTGNIGGRLDSWKKKLNEFRLAATRRPGRTIQSSSLVPSTSGMPPSAWIISPTIDKGYIIKELPWPVDCLPHDFPVTWGESFGGIGWVDSARIGQTLYIHAKSDGSWYTLGSETNNATDRARIVWENAFSVIEEGGWSTQVVSNCPEFPGDTPVFCHRQGTAEEQDDTGTPDYINTCDWLPFESFLIWYSDYLTCYSSVWNWFFYNTWNISCSGGQCYWGEPPTWHWFGFPEGTYCFATTSFDQIPCIAKVMRNSANVKNFDPAQCWTFLQGIKKVYIDYDAMPVFPAGITAPAFPPLNPPE